MIRRSGIVLMIGVALALHTGCWFGTGSTSDIARVRIQKIRGEARRSA